MLFDVTIDTFESIVPIRLAGFGPRLGASALGRGKYLLREWGVPEESFGSLRSRALRCSVAEPTHEVGGAAGLCSRRIHVGASAFGLA
jgi:hypothetical protein